MMLRYLTRSNKKYNRGIRSSSSSCETLEEGNYQGNTQQRYCIGGIMENLEKIT